MCNSFHDVAVKPLKFHGTAYKLFREDDYGELLPLCKNSYMPEEHKESILHYKNEDHRGFNVWVDEMYQPWPEEKGLMQGFCFFPEKRTAERAAKRWNRDAVSSPEDEAVVRKIRYENGSDSFMTEEMFGDKIRIAVCKRFKVID